MPFLYEVLDGSSVKMQDLVIRKIPELVPQIEYSVLVAEITPRLMKLVTIQPSLRLNGLVCMNKVLPSLDRGHILEQILPALESFVNLQDPKTMVNLCSLWRASEN